MTFAPQLVLEVSSHFTRLKDRNTKSDLYEMNEVKYFIIGDYDKKTTEIFELIDNKYKETGIKRFLLTKTCDINFDAFNLFI